MWEHARPEARRVQFCKMTYPFIPLSFFALPLKKQNQGIQNIWDRKWVRQEKGCGLKKSGFWGWARASNRPRVIDGGRGLGGRKRSLRVNRFRLESEWQRGYVWRSITPSKKVILHWNADGRRDLQPGESLMGQKEELEFPFLYFKESGDNTYWMYLTKKGKLEIKPGPGRDIERAGEWVLDEITTVNKHIRATYQ